MSKSFYWYYIKKEELSNTLEILKEEYNKNIINWNYGFSFMKDIGIKIYNHSSFYVFEIFWINFMSNFNLNKHKHIKKLFYSDSWESYKKDKLNLEIIESIDLNNPFLIIDFNKPLSYYEFPRGWKKKEITTHQDYEYIIENWMFWIKLLCVLDDSYLFEIWLLEHKESFNHFINKKEIDILNHNHNLNNLIETSSFLNKEKSLTIKIKNFHTNFIKLKNIKQSIKILQGKDLEKQKKLISNLRYLWKENKEPSSVEMIWFLNNEYQETQNIIEFVGGNKKLKNKEDVLKLCKGNVEFEILINLMKLMKNIDFKNWENEINEKTIWKNIINS